MERLQMVKNSILNSKNVKIFFEKNPSTDYLSAVLAIYSTLKKMNKQVFMPIENLSDEAITFLSSEKKKISISLEKEISEIYYDKSESGIKLNIIPKNNNVGIEDFSWEINSVKKDFKNDQLESFDLVICIGLPRFEQLDKLLQADEEELFECTIINIDNNINNENYGDINIIEQKTSLSKIISVLIKQLGKEYYSKETMSFLLGGFFSQEKIKKEEANIIKWLIRNGGNFNFYYSIKNSIKPEWLDSLKKYLTNISLSENKEIIFSYLNEKEISTKNILNITKIFHEWIDPPSFFLSFIDSDNKTTKTIFYSSSPLIIEKIKKYYSGNFKENGGIITSNKNPEETTQQLKEII